MKKSILVTGGNGQVGRSLKNALNHHPEFTGIVLDRSSFDLLDQQMMTRVFNEVSPDFVINAAAYTKVDLAEEDKKNAELINANACEHLGQLCQQTGIPILHYSSDYVYHNGLDRPLLETDALKPQSVYAVTKQLGEKAIESASEKHFIIRTSWVYDAYGSNFVRTMLALASKHPKLTVVDDQIGSPTYAPDIANISLSIISSYFKEELGKEDFGIYNFSNEGICSWYDFAQAIFELREIDVVVKPVPSSSFPRPAPRPNYSVLSKEKIRHLLPDFSIPHWRTSLKQCLEEMK